MIKALARTFAHAAVRRIAVVVVLAFCAYLGIGKAQAVNPYHPTIIMQACANEKASFERTVNGLKYIAGACQQIHGLYSVKASGQAPESCVADQTTTDPKRGVICLPKWRCSEANPSNCASEGVAQWGYLLDEACPAGTHYDTATQSCKSDCSLRPDVTVGAAIYGMSTDGFCDNGCTMIREGSLNLSPTGDTCTASPFYPDLANPDGDNCVGTDGAPADPQACAGDADGDGVPDDVDQYPNDPGESTDTDGDGIGDNGDFNPDDPDNGKDDGTGDNEDDNESTGGGNCGNAPVSSGDAIAAQIAFQAWSTRCEQIAGNAIADAHKKVAEATKALIAVQGDNIADFKEEQALSNAKLDALKAQNMVSMAQSTAAVQSLQAKYALEEEETQFLLDQIRAKYGDEEAATRVRIDALNAKYADEAAATRQKLQDLGLIDNAKQDEQVAKLEQAVQKEAETKAAIDALTAKMGEQVEEAKKTTTNTGAILMEALSQTTLMGQMRVALEGMKSQFTDGTAKVTCENCAGGSTDMTETNGLLGGIKGWLEGDAGGVDTGPMDATTGAQAWGEDREIGGTAFDQSGFGWSRSCPAPPSFDVFGHNITLDNSVVCDWLAVGGWFVLLITAIACIRAVGNA